MRTLLINPCRTFTGEGNQEGRLSAPLELMGIASYLEQNGIQASILDPLIASNTRIRETGPDSIHFGTGDEHIKQVVERERPDVVGICAPFTAQAHNALLLADLVKQVNPHIFVIGGGPHFSVAHKDFLTSNPNFDCVVCGEGEVPIHSAASSVGIEW